MTAVSTAPDGWVAVSGADFGEKGASAVRMKVRSEVPGRIEILTGLENSEPILSLEIAAGESYTDVTAELPEKLRGIHDIYFCFSESGTALLEWQFRQEP